MSPRGRPRLDQTDVRTKIAEWRVEREMTQEEAAYAASLPLSTYWEYERGLIAGPNVKFLANLAIAFGCEIEDLIEDEWRQGEPRRSFPIEPYRPVNPGERMTEAKAIKRRTK